MSIKINNQTLENVIEEIASKENRSKENMAETILKDFVKDYTGVGA